VKNLSAAPAPLVAKLHDVAAGNQIMLALHHANAGNVQERSLSSYALPGSNKISYKDILQGNPARKIVVDLAVAHLSFSSAQLFYKPLFPGDSTSR